MNKQQLRRGRMLTDPMHRIVPSMALPTIVAFLINAIYGLADTFFVSSLGTNATAAVSVNASLDQIIFMAGSLLAIGANSYVARLLGADKEEKASQVLSTAFFTAMGVGAVVLVLGLSNMRGLVRLLGATDSCEQYAMDYARYVLLVAPIVASNFVMNQCLRAEGSATLSMFGMGFGGILNCVLDPIFIFTLDLGVAGASIATAISRTVSFGILIFPYLTKRSLLRLSPRLICFSRDIVTQIATVGSSSFFRNLLAVLAAIVLNKLAGGISDSVLAAVGVTNKVMMFPFNVVLGFGSGFQPVAGFNWGAKRYDRVLDCYRFASRTALWGTALMGLALGVFAPQAMSLFTESDPELMRLGALSIRLQCLVLPVHAWVAVVNMYCSGLGLARKALLLSTARQGSCFLPIVWPLSLWLGAYGVVIVQAVADVLTLALAVPVIVQVTRMVKERMEKGCESEELEALID